MQYFASMPAVLTAPTMADAQRAAAAVSDGGAACVMLFGSVARGEQTADSDIDLVAVFDDLGDYEERLSIEGDLKSMARDAAGRRVDVYATDWPEWEHRSTRMRTTFESGVRSDALVLAGSQEPGPNIDWNKEIGLPRTNWEEALTSFFHTHQGLRLLITMYRSDPSDEPPTLSPETNPQDPARQRLVGVCFQAHAVTENALTTLIHCQGRRRPQRTHQLHELLALVEQPPRSQIENALDPILDIAGSEPPGEPYINWRIHGTYVTLRPIPVNPPMADDHVLAALKTASIVIDEISRTIDDDRITLAQTTLDEAWTTYHAINIATGKPFPTSS